MMQLTRKIGGAVLALGLAFGTGDAGAQSTDLRTLGTKNDALAWQSVGRLDVRGKGYCTGTLIAPDLVLTAAHCVYDGGSIVRPQDMAFQAGLTNGTAAARRIVSQIEAHAGYHPTRGYDLNNVRHDLALVRLEEPIPTSELDPFAVFSGTMPNGPVSVVSYGRGRSDALSRQNECQVLGKRDRLIALDCDVTFGSSGAPVFTHLNGRGQIASVISGGGTYGGAEVAFGMSLPPLISDLKRQMYANKARPTAKVRRITVGGGNGASGAKFVKPNGS